MCEGVFRRFLAGLPPVQKRFYFPGQVKRVDGSNLTKIRNQRSEMKAREFFRQQKLMRMIDLQTNSSITSLK